MEVMARLTKKPVITDDRGSLDWPLFVPFKMKRATDEPKLQYNGYYSRCTDNVIESDLLVLDIDNDPTRKLPYFSIADAKEMFAGVSYALYTSYNHLNPKKHNVEKFRHHLYELC